MGKLPTLTPIYGKNEANERIQLGFKEAGNANLIPVGSDGKPLRVAPKLKTYKSTTPPAKTTTKKFGFKKKSRK